MSEEGKGEERTERKTEMGPEKEICHEEWNGGKKKAWRYEEVMAVRKYERKEIFMRGGGKNGSMRGDGAL